MIAWEKLRTAGALALGATMSLTPFLRYRWGAPHPTAHADHEPHHGGVLGMVGDRHLEIVRAGGRVECHPSDAHRRPIEPVGGQVECAGGEVIPAAVDGSRLVAPDRCQTNEVTCHVLLDDGTSLRMSADVPPSAFTSR
jgi:uncharacterized Zn-binding protein involved in type VI secretion